MKDMILNQAGQLQGWLEEVRRDLHMHPETGFELNHTLEKVRTELKAMGYEPKDCGKAGIVALAGGKKPGKTILLRADMDALPIQEALDLPFASQSPNKMHACGHDFHTTMLLGAAKLLKEHEDEIEGTVKLAFQPAEEIFLGAKDMIENGLLENPKVDAAYMFHVVIGTDIPSGTVIVLADGAAMSSCEQYYIKVTGKGGHGSTPHVAIDPITAAAQIHVALAEINSRELDAHEYGVFTTCRFQAGHASNIIPAHAEMWGTIRTNDPTGVKNEFIKTRIDEVAKGVGAALRCSVETRFFDYCPCVKCDPDLSAQLTGYAAELVGEEHIVKYETPSVGSEDFAFISQAVPSVCFNLGAGSFAEGYPQAVHHPESLFNEDVLRTGAAAYAYMALQYLKQEAK
ncbi:MAG: amidohydrolase [Firmicutes bacterium]|nr:amidohydrolase [Bacillota bacterium]